MSRPRVLVGTFEIGGFCADLADGLRALGCEVTTAMSVGLAYFTDRRYDVDLADVARAADWRAVDAALAAGRRPRGRDATAVMARLVADHDVFVMVHASLRPWHPTVPWRMGLGREYATLARHGKRVVGFFTGPDVRHASAYDQQCAALGHRAATMGEMAARWADRPLAPSLRNLRMTERHATAIFSQPNQSGLAVRPYHHLFAPVALDRYDARVPDREVPVVVHAPTDRGVKGTGPILDALERLRARGVRFELRLLEHASHPELRAALADADVLVDQIHLPLHGKLAVEGMASGCAVAGCDRADLEPFPARRPIFHLEPDGLDARLAHLLTDRALRRELAHAGRAYVERHHGHVRVAARLLAAADGTLGPCEHRPRFFAERYAPPPGTAVPAYLRRLTGEVLRAHGLPRGVSVGDLARRGLVDARTAARDAEIPRWAEA
ncbi:MAG: glycosyltransferase [Polyangiales bacterium]